MTGFLDFPRVNIRQSADSRKGLSWVAQMCSSMHNRWPCILALSNHCLHTECMPPITVGMKLSGVLSWSIHHYLSNMLLYLLLMHTWKKYYFEFSINADVTLANTPWYIFPPQFRWPWWFCPHGSRALLFTVCFHSLIDRGIFMS